MFRIFLLRGAIVLNFFIYICFSFEIWTASSDVTKHLFYGGTSVFIHQHHISVEFSSPYSKWLLLISKGILNRVSEVGAFL